MSFWEKFVKFISPRGKEEPKPRMPITSELPAPSGESDASASASLELEICLQTDLGSVRANNEDRGIYRRPTDLELAASKGTLVMVADGMGGASAGEIASEMAIRVVPDLYYNSLKPPALALKEALEAASKDIHRAAQADPERIGMGTTCVAVAIITPQVYVAYVGDSRLYMLRDDGFYQLTEDHTVVGDMVRKGIITRDQARRHEERNVLSLSLGGRPEITASHWEKPMILRAGDRLLLCSDGLHDLVSDSEMQAIIAGAPTHVAVQELIDAAKRNGGHDNITAGLVHAFVPVANGDAISKPTREILISSE
jgi:PPM family protein phosphatase